MKIRKVAISDIISFLGNQIIRVYGDIDNIFIDNLADVAHTNTTTLDWVNPHKANKQQVSETSKAKVLLVDEEVAPIPGKTLIVVKNPKVALAEIGNEFFVDKIEAKIHPTAIVSPNAKIGENVYIGPYSVVDAATIGDDCIIESNVRIYECVTMGKGCRIKSGSILGGDGFGFEKDEDGNRFRFPQIGSLILGDYVEVGGNTCIDRGALSDTVISDYTKIDNLCHIAHNVHLGRNVMVIACSEISGSCILGDEVWTGPNCCIRDQRSIGSNTMIGMGSVVVRNIPEGEIWAGNPAKEFRKK